MKKNIERYFGNNFATVLYIVSGLLIAGGLVGIFLRRWIVIMAALTIVGVVLFFITIRLKITDKDFDEPMKKAAENYKKDFISGKTVDRKMLDEDDFDVFSGYLFDPDIPNLKRKVGTDGKNRSSRYYVAALKATRTEFAIFYSEYDLLSGEDVHRFVNGKRGDAAALTRPASKPDFGDYRYELRIEKNGTEETLVFHLPDDALVDEKLKLIENL